MKKIFVVAGIAVFSVLTTGVAMAAGAVTTPSFQLPEGLDANGDGAVTRAEYRAFFDRQFNNMDTNRNGKITKKEFIAGIQRQIKNIPQPPASTH